MNLLFLPIKIHAQMRRETGVGWRGRSGVHMIPGACAERNMIFNPRPFCFSALQREITHLFIIFLQRFPFQKKERKEKGFCLNIIFPRFMCNERAEMNFWRLRGGNGRMAFARNSVLSSWATTTREEFVKCWYVSVDLFSLH